MIFSLLLIPAFAFWPFDTALDLETSQKLLWTTIKELGASEEEAGLLTKAYLEANPKISLQTLVDQIQEQKFSEFINEWRAGLFKNIVSEETLRLSKLIDNPPFTFELYKALTLSFDDVYTATAEEVKEEVIGISCPDGSQSSYRI